MAKRSEMSWRGYEDVPKVCSICAGPVTLTGKGGGFQAHTDCATGQRTVTHTECQRRIRGSSGRTAVPMPDDTTASCPPVATLRHRRLSRPFAAGAEERVRA